MTSINPIYLSMKSPHDSRPDPLLTAALEKWVSQPRAEANYRAVGVLAVSMLIISMAAWELPNRVSFLRNMALMFVALHGLLHWIWVWMLSRLRDQRVPLGDMALSAYLDPWRVSHLDTAAAWLAFAAVVPYINRG